MDSELDIFGQQPFFTINIQTCFCFPLPDNYSRRLITNKLNNALEHLYASFPWLAGEVVNEGSSDGNSGVFKFKPLENVPRLLVKDLRDEAYMPTMDSLRRAKFPMGMLDENIVAPLKIFVDDKSKSAPVFLVQASFITGGLLLTFVAQHNTMDMTGLGHIIHLFSKACHDEEFSPKDLLCGNLPRRDIVPLLDDSITSDSELDRYIIRPAAKDALSGPKPSTPPKCTWAYLIFPSSSIVALKSLAMDSLTSTSFVSSDDALTAFIWQSISHARLPRLGPSDQSTLMRAVNVRQYLGIPATYPGPIQSNAYTSRTVLALSEEPLGSVASDLRSALEPGHSDSDLGYHTRAIATFLSRTPDKNVFSFGASIHLPADVILSSWSKVNCYALDFNLGLGMPEAVRKPRQTTEVEGLVFLMPKKLEGEIAVAICLRDEDMARLKIDPAVLKYAEYIG
jgi:hypothetical protein